MSVIYWCNTHKRRATSWRRQDGKPCCDPHLGGILLPCLDVVAIPAIVVDGWAVHIAGVIDVATVSPSRRAAVVNWLVVRKDVEIFNTFSDSDIEEVWEAHHGGADVIEVEIAPKGMSAVPKVRP